jgi:hypothetical protein
MVFFRIIMLFFLACFVLLSLGVAIEPAAPIFMRILGGAGAAALTICCFILIDRGIEATIRTLRGKK